MLLPPFSLLLVLSKLEFKLVELAEDARDVASDITGVSCALLDSISLLAAISPPTSVPFCSARVFCKVAACPAGPALPAPASATHIPYQPKLSYR